ncbi:MAG: PilZ domain-containing protein [Treponema sp.]|jgi:hypothetical protein|nr:PilZ domain-containing protein [Treponema sp.]
MVLIKHNDLRMIEKRKHIRYRTLVKACIIGVPDGDVIVKDLSVTGCRIEAATYISIAPNTTYTLEVTPEHAAKIGKFELSVESRWMRAGIDSCEIGFAILASPKGKFFERYVDYLAWQSSKV